MTAPKMSPLGYALASIVAVPFVVLAVLFLLVLVLVYWVVIPFVVYAVAKKYRKNYGKVKVPCDDPANCGCAGFEPEDGLDPFHKGEASHP